MSFLRIFSTISSIVSRAFRSSYSRKRLISSRSFVVLMIRWLIDCRRWSAKEVMLAVTYSRGIPCSSIRIVVVDLYVAGMAKATTAARTNTPRAGTRIAHFLRRRIPARSFTDLTSRSVSIVLPSFIKRVP